MCKETVIFFTITFLAITAHCQEDPFTKLEKHISNTLAYHYLWPWNQIFKVATSFEDDPQATKDPQIITEDPGMFVVKLNVEMFKPEELNVTVKHQYIMVEGKREKKEEDKPSFLHNHFIMRFVIPSESKPEEVTATWEDGVLYLRAPKYELPPPLPERVVPIEIKTLSATEKPGEETSPEEEKVEKEQEPPISISSSSSLSQELKAVEATTRVGKIRKKELKLTKTAKDNEVKKNRDSNGLDYAIIEADE